MRAPLSLWRRVNTVVPVVLERTACFAVLRPNITRAALVNTHSASATISAENAEHEAPPEPAMAPVRSPAAASAYAVKGGVLTGGLYLVATPIGNLGDITLRALSVLGGCSLVLAEDTRHTRKLLSHHSISTETMSYHAHNEKEREALLVQRLMAGEAIALVSDAGTPAISDPGHALVAAAVRHGITVVPIPGPCAVVAAVIASGLPTDAFMFCGFLPPKSVARRKRLQELVAVPATLAFYVPPHGLLATLRDMVATLGPSRPCCVAREMTKIYEEFYRSTLEEAAAEFERREPRGEIVVLVGAHVRTASEDQDESELSDVLQSLLDSGTPVSSAVREAMEAVGTRVGARKKDVYDLALTMKRGMKGAVTPRE